MNFHTFGDKENKAIVLIHGMLTPWQIWNTAINTFSKDHYVIVPELDAHTEEAPTAFNSVEEESEKIHEYIMDELNGQVYLLAGLSMGGRIAATLAKNGDLIIENLVLDGAPVTKVNGLMRWFMKSGYKSIITKSKKHDPKIMEQAKKDFLPEELLPYYIKIADNMNMESVDNIIDSVFSEFSIPKYRSGMKILFMHGTKGKEASLHKYALKMKEANPQTEIRCFEGLAHAELACFKPEQWVKEVLCFC